MTYESALEMEVAEKYMSSGYEVKPGSEFGTIEIPSGRFEPDLVAIRGNERVVIEIAGRSLRPEGLHYLADIVRSKGWRLDVVNGPLQRENGKSEPHSLSLPDIERRISQASQLAKSGDSDMGLLIAWTALESLLRTHDEQLGVELRAKGVPDLLKQNASLGILEETEFATLMRTAQIRNHVAHGLDGGTEAKPALVSLLSMLDVLKMRLLEPSDLLESDDSHD